MQCSLAGLVLALSPLPPGLNEFTRLEGRGGALSVIRKASAAAVGRALADGKQLLEIEFPPLLETKTQFDDFSNVEVLDANRDFGVQLAIEPEVKNTVAPEDAASLWLVFADDGEAELAQEAWPGKAFQQCTTTSIASAITDRGGEPLRPMGSNAADLFGGLFGPPPPPPAPPAPPPTLQLCVQPGEGGPMEDWLNLELLREEGVPMLTVNGALDKVTSGYYSNLLNPKLAACAERFYSQFEQVYYCKPIGAGRGWLFRVYGEPWQLHRQSKEGLTLVETYEERPTPQVCVDRLKLP